MGPGTAAGSLYSINGLPTLQGKPSDARALMDYCGVVAAAPRALEAASAMACASCQ
jgi:hypothetical protein